MATPRKKQSDQDRWKDKFGRQAPRRQERLLSLVGVRPAEEEEPAAPEDQSAEGQSLGPTVGPAIPKKSLRTDRQSEVVPQPGEGILLAPLQWEVWQVLEAVAASRAIISVRQIANQVGASIEGVKKAIRVLKQVGILQTTAVRTADVQGFQVDLKTTIPVRKGTLNEARGIVKRLGLTPNGRPRTTVRQEEDEILRQYMAAPEEQRREIDRRAEEKLKKMSRMVAQVGPDKHQAILVQARIDAARAVLAVSADDASETGEAGRPA